MWTFTDCTDVRPRSTNKYQLYTGPRSHRKVQRINQNGENALRKRPGGTDVSMSRGRNGDTNNDDSRFFYLFQKDKYEAPTKKPDSPTSTTIPSVQPPSPPPSYQPPSPTPTPPTTTTSPTSTPTTTTTPPSQPTSTPTTTTPTATAPTTPPARISANNNNTTYKETLIIHDKDNAEAAENIPQRIWIQGHSYIRESGSHPVQSGLQLDQFVTQSPQLYDQIVVPQYINRLMNSGRQFHPAVPRKRRLQRKRQNLKKMRRNHHRLRQRDNPNSRTESQGRSHANFSKLRVHRKRDHMDKVTKNSRRLRKLRKSEFQTGSKVRSNGYSSPRQRRRLRRRKSVDQ